MNCRVATLLSALLILIISSFAFAQNKLKEGWNEETISEATRGCVSSVLNPQIQEFKRRTNYISNDIPPDLEKRLPELKAEFGRMCKCLIQEMAQQRSLQEFQQIPQSENQKFFKETFCSKKCKIAFDAPIDCSK